MSRILEFQPADEQTVVARVLLELHQAIDTCFPDAKGSSRQFTKTVLSTRGENPGIDLQASTAGHAAGETPTVVRKSDKNRSRDRAGDRPPVQVVTSRQELGSELQFSRADSNAMSLTPTALEESPWRRKLTKVLIASLVIGLVLLAWIYLFGAPRL